MNGILRLSFLSGHSPASVFVEPPRRELEMAGEGACAVGKRQVRPNLSRSDFGYVERSRTSIAKQPKKARKGEEEDGEAANGSDGAAVARPGRSEKEARNLVCRYPLPHAFGPPWPSHPSTVMYRHAPLLLSV